MRSHSLTVASIVAAMLAMATNAGAQSATAVRELGRLEHASTDSLSSVTSALAMPRGGVLVNDVIGRRVLLLDSALSHPVLVADATSATGNAYGNGPATLIRYRGDTVLLISPSTLSMLVITPGGAIARVMAIPRPNEAQSLLPIYGVPGFDGRGRLVYFGGGGSVLPGILMLRKGRPLPPLPEFAASLEAGRRVDSSYIARVDLATRAVDTAAWVRVPKGRREVRLDAQGAVVAIETTPDPLPLVDAWTVMRDGTIAIVRGIDYHVDWLSPDGHWSHTPKMPFDWQRVTDERKQTLIDSTVRAWQATYDEVETRRQTGGVGAGGNGGRGGGAAGSSGSSGSGSAAGIAPTIAKRAPLSDVPDYFPPFSQELTEPPVQPDADGNLWIRTTTVRQGRPVYDIIDRRGIVVDRVQLPAFRTIAGFAPGVVYMAVKDGAGIVHLERAKVK